MPYCSQCGVEVHQNTNNCPLCRAPIQKLQQDAQPERHYPNEASPTAALPPLTFREKLRLARGISFIAFLIPILFTTAIDYFINRQISWSSYVIISLAGMLLITMAALFIPKHGGWVNFSSHFILAVVCLAMNQVTGWQYHWSFAIALPILGFSWFITLGILKVAAKKKGHLLAAAILVGVGLLCLAVDGVLSIYLFATLRLGWSLIVISALIPTALLLLYLYSASFRKSRFRRFIHI